MDELAFAIDVARGAGRIHMDNLGRVGTEFKGLEPVTESDRKSNVYIVNRLTGRFTYGIVSEEMPEVKGKSYVWYVDPLDGTAQFTYRVPLFCVSIGLAKNNRPVMGVVYNPYTDDLYFADEKGAIFENERLGIKRRIKVNDTDLNTASININGPQHKDIELFSRLGDIFTPPIIRRKVIHAGPSALELSFTAAGSRDGYVAHYQHPYDIAAGMVIARLADAVVLDFEGNNADVNTQNLLAAHPRLAEQMLKKLEGLTY